MIATQWSAERCSIGSLACATAFASILLGAGNVSAQSNSPFQRPRQADGRGSALESVWNRQNAPNTGRRPGSDPDHAPIPPRSRRPGGNRNYVQPIIQPNTAIPLAQPQSATRSRASLQIINRAPAADELPPKPEIDDNPLLDVKPAPEGQPPLEPEFPLPVISSPTPATAAMIKDGAEVIEQLDRELRNQSEDEQRRLDNIRNQLQQLNQALTHRLDTQPRVDIVPPEATPVPPPMVEPMDPGPLETPSYPELKSPGDLPPERRAEPKEHTPIERGSDTGSMLPKAAVPPQAFPDLQPNPAPVIPIESVKQTRNAPPAQPAPETPDPPAQLPSGDVVTSGAVDRLGLADSFYASGQLGIALQAYRELAPTLQGEDRVWVDYQMGNALRRLQQPKDAETMYREVAAQSAPSWVVESARWWLKSLDKQTTIQQGIAEIEAQLGAN